MLGRNTITFLLLCKPFLAASINTFELAETQHNHSDLIRILEKRQGASSCTLNCFATILPQFDCPDLLQCICHDDAVADALRECATASKCSIKEALEGQKAQAETCGFPKRNRVMVFAVTQTVLFVLSMICALMRVLARGRYFGGAGFGWDDGILLATCLPIIGVTAVAYLEQTAGLGRDVWELDFGQVERVIMLFYIGNTFYPPVVFGTKIAFVLLYLRIWKDSSMIFRRICQVVLVLLVIAALSFTFSTIFLCAPVIYIWTALSGAKGSCVNREAQLYANSGVNIVMDFVVLLLPVPSILQLRMNRPKKVGLLCTFLVGFAATGTSIIQFYYLVTRVSNTENPTWDFFEIGLWRGVEMYLSIICCCMPMIAGLSKRLLSRASDVVSVTSTFSKMWNNTNNLSSSTSSRTRRDAKPTADGTLTGSVGVRRSWVELKNRNHSSNEEVSRTGAQECCQPQEGHTSNRSDTTTTVVTVTPMPPSMALTRGGNIQQSHGELYQSEHPVRSKAGSRRRGYSTPDPGQNTLVPCSQDEVMDACISKMENGTVPHSASVTRTGNLGYVDDAACHDLPSLPFLQSRVRSRYRAETMPSSNSGSWDKGSRTTAQIPGETQRRGGTRANDDTWTALTSPTPSPVSNDSQETVVTSDRILTWARRSQSQILHQAQLPPPRTQIRPCYGPLNGRMRSEVCSYSDQALPRTPDI